jgi:hypothetical protein
MPRLRYAPGECFFRFELTGFPGTSPEVKIWNTTSDTILAIGQRPKGSNRVTETFKSWNSETVYRPWDRYAGVHGNWVTTYPTLVWTPKRDITFILEDLHGILTSNAVVFSLRPIA